MLPEGPVCVREFCRGTEPPASNISIFVPGSFRLTSTRARSSLTGIPVEAFATDEYGNNVILYGDILSVEFTGPGDPMKFGSQRLFGPLIGISE
jgi:hypothetical protein